jgi:hypothetical protein
MKAAIGALCVVLGAILLWGCGVGVFVSLILAILSLVGLTFIKGAGVLIFYFVGGWLLGVVALSLGYGLLS